MNRDTKFKPFGEGPVEMNSKSLVFDRDVARAGRWQFVDIDEKTFMGIARIEGKHTVVDVFLDASAVIARSQCTARGSWIQTSFNALRLSVISNILNDDAPFSFNIHGTNWTSVKDVARTNVSFTSDPVALVERIAIVQGIIEVVFILGGDSIDQIVGRLISYFGVLFQHQRIVFDGVLK